MIKVTDNHEQRLLRAAPALVIPAMGEELVFGAREIAEDAIFSIRDGAISGPGHVPSAPGEPPNEDTGELASSIRPLELVETPTSAQTGVISDSDHSLYQERGTSKMAARPFLEPAAERHRGDVLAALAGRFREMLG